MGTTIWNQREEMKKGQSEKHLPTLECPFCGVANAMEQNDHGVFWITCNECGANGPLTETGDSAAQRWNHRKELKREKWEMELFLEGIPL